jgi:hypothetical protein
MRGHDSVFLEASHVYTDMMYTKICSLFDVVEVFGYIKIIYSSSKTPAYHAHLYSLNMTSSDKHILVHLPSTLQLDAFIQHFFVTIQDLPSA